MIIAIDGYSGTGKSSLGKDIAKKLNFNFIDSGALYRVFGLLAYRCKLNTNSIEEVENFIIKNYTLDINYNYDLNKREVKVFILDEDISKEIRTLKVSKMVSKISSNKKIRAIVNNKIRHLANNKNVVIDGRDIGTIVFPYADIKIFVTCDVEIRAKRRAIELGIFEVYEIKKIKENLISRDYDDENRKEAPLKKTKDYFEIDTSSHTPESQLNQALKYIENKL